MPEQTPETLNHFAIVSFTDDFQRLDAGERRREALSWLDRMRASADVLHCYQLDGLEARNSLLLWTACASADPDRVRRFFTTRAEVHAGTRHLFRQEEVLWGFTRPSQYTKTRSTQELDPFAPREHPYLIVYPFVKTAGWYQLDREERQRLMAGHIRTGTQYKDITQLLLYSFGLQDQEFVVVYETADLRRFLGLVQELRGTEARTYTERDAPLHVGILLSDDEALATWV